MDPMPEIKSPMAKKALAALEGAVEKVVEDHRRRGAPLAVWRDGKAVWEMPPPVAGVQEEQGAHPLDGDNAAKDSNEGAHKDDV